MALYSLDIQSRGECFTFDGRRLRSFSSLDPLLNWIEQLPSGTTLLAEMGGAADPVVLVAAEKIEDVEIWTVPTTYEKRARSAYGIAGRKRDAEVLYRMFADPQWRGAFHEHQAADEQLVHLCTTYPTLVSLIAQRVALQNGMTATYHRAATLGRRAGQKIDEYVKERCANNSAFAATVEEEEDYRKQAEKEVQRLPAYQRLLAPIAGIGPRIASGIVSGIRIASRFVPKACASYRIIRECCLE